MFGAVPGDDRDIAGPQEIDPAVLVFELNDIAGLDGLVRQEDEAGYQVGEDFLQAEAQPQAQGAAEQGEDGEVEAQVGQDQDHRGGIEKNAAKPGQEDLDGGTEV